MRNALRYNLKIIILAPTFHLLQYSETGDLVCD
jgi:hypothetical protein